MGKSDEYLASLMGETPPVEGEGLFTQGRHALGALVGSVGALGGQVAGLAFPDAYQRAFQERVANAGPEDQGLISSINNAPGFGATIAEAISPGTPETGLGRVAKHVGGMAGDFLPYMLLPGGAGLKGGMELLKGGEILKGAGAILGSNLPAAAAFGPELVQGIYQGGKQTVEDIGQGEWGKAAEHGSEALLMSGLGALMAHGSIHELQAMKALRASRGQKITPEVVDPRLAATTSTGVPTDAPLIPGEGANLQGSGGTDSYSPNPFTPRPPDPSLSPRTGSDITPAPFIPPPEGGWGPGQSTQSFLPPPVDMVVPPPSPDLSPTSSTGVTSAPVDVNPNPWGYRPPSGSGGMFTLPGRPEPPPRPEVILTPQPPGTTPSRPKTPGQIQGTWMEGGEKIDPSLPMVEPDTPLQMIEADPETLPLIEADPESKTNGKYTPEIRDKVLGEITNTAFRATGEGSIPFLAKKYGIAQNTLRKWHAEAKAAEVGEAPPVHVDQADTPVYTPLQALQQEHIQRLIPEVTADLIKEKGAAFAKRHPDIIQKLAEKEYFIRANHMTGLPGIGAFNEAVARLKSDPADPSGNRKQAAFISADGRKFKDWNDEFGHENGDMALQAMGHLWAKASAEFPGTQIFQPSGDEFRGIAENLAQAHQIGQRFQELTKGATIEINHKGSRRHVGLPEIDYGAAEGEFKHADTVLEEVKERRRTPGGTGRRRDDGGGKGYYSEPNSGDGSTPAHSRRTSDSSDPGKEVVGSGSDEELGGNKGGGDEGEGGSSPANGGVSNVSKQLGDNVGETQGGKAKGTVSGGSEGDQTGSISTPGNEGDGLTSSPPGSPPGVTPPTLPGNGKRTFSPTRTRDANSKMPPHEGGKVRDPGKISAQQALIDKQTALLSQGDNATNPLISDEVGNAIIEHGEAPPTDLPVEATPILPESKQLPPGSPTTIEDRFKQTVANTPPEAPLSFLQRAGKDALDRLNTQKGTANELGAAAWQGAKTFKDTVIYLSSLIDKGVRDFATASKRMISEFGEGITPHLKRLWARAQEHWETFKAKKDEAFGPSEAGAVALGPQGLKGIKPIPLPKRASINETAPTHTSLKEEIPRLTERGTSALLKIHKEGSPAEYKEALKKAKDPKWSEMFSEAYKAGLVSGPPSWIANIGSNALVRGLSDWEHTLAVGLDSARSKLTGSKRERFMDEIPARMGAYKAALSGEDGAISNLVRNHFGVTLDPLENKFGGKTQDYPNAIPGKLGEGIRVPFKIMDAWDSVFKHLSGFGQASDLAIRKAKGKGLKGDAFKAEYNRLFKEMKDVASNGKESKHYGRYKEEFEQIQSAYLEDTFQSALGPIGQAVKGLAASHPLIGSALLPFITVPANVAKATLKRTPLAFLHGEVSIPNLIRKVKNGTLSGADMDALAKPLTGSMIALGFGMAAAEGFVTGGGPSDPKLRAALEESGWQPYSIKIGKSFVSLQRFEPISSIIGMAADVVEGHQSGAFSNPHDAVEKIAGSIGENLTSKTFLAGLEGFATAWHDPVRYGGRWIRQMEASLVPNIVAKTAQAIDPVFRQTDTATLDPITARIPFASRTLPAQTSPSGAERLRKGTPLERLASPLPRSEEKGEEGDLGREFASIGWAPSRPKRSIYVEGRKITLTQEEISRLEKAQVAASKAAMVVLKDPTYLRLPKNEESPEFTPGRKTRADVLENIYRRQRRVVLADVTRSAAKRSRIPVTP